MISADAVPVERGPRTFVLVGHGDSSEVLTGVHLPSQCKGQVCSIHNLSAHSMRTFPQHWRSDRKIMERICPHGVGHPDPDDYKVRLYPAEGVHGCDGCCSL